MNHIIVYYNKPLNLTTSSKQFNSKLYLYFF
jgi:hypothetical protein